MDDRDLFLRHLDANPPPDKDRGKGKAASSERTPAETTLDLHGMTVAEAETALSVCIREGHARGVNKINLITGKGIHSKKGRATLRESMTEGLNHGRYGKIRSFRTGRAKEGGSGVLVILL